MGYRAEIGRFERTIAHLHKCLLKIPRHLSKNKEALRKSGEKSHMQTLNITSVLSAEHGSVLKHVFSDQEGAGGVRGLSS